MQSSKWEQLTIIDAPPTDAKPIECEVVSETPKDHPLEYNSNKIRAAVNTTYETILQPPDIMSPQSHTSGTVSDKVYDV